jgi:hypothetical protein
MCPRAVSMALSIGQVPAFLATPRCKEICSAFISEGCRLQLWIAEVAPHLCAYKFLRVLVREQ